MRHFAIVGSGPAGFYTAEALAKAYGDQARIDIFDRYPVPYGLIRFGVAPDHQSLKAVSKRYDKVAETKGVRSSAMSRSARTLQSTISARSMMRSSSRSAPRMTASSAFRAKNCRVSSARRSSRLVQRPSRFRRPGPAARQNHAAVIGAGNVALDCARILAKTAHEFEGSDITAHSLAALERRRSEPLPSSAAAVRTR